MMGKGLEESKLKKIVGSLVFTSESQKSSLKKYMYLMMVAVMEEMAVILNALEMTRMEIMTKGLSL